MKKLGISTMLLLIWSLCLAPAAFATNHTWADSSYDFKKVNMVAIKDLDTSQVDISSIMQKTANSTYQKMSSKLENAKVLTQEEALAKIEKLTNIPTSTADTANALTTVWQENIQSAAPFYVEATMTHYYIDSIYCPERVTYSTVRRTEICHDRNGRRWERVWYDTIPQYIPAHIEYTFRVGIYFKGYDAKTHKLVYEREDIRSRGTDDPTGMIERICKDFYRDLNKRIKK